MVICKIIGHDSMVKVFRSRETSVIALKKDAKDYCEEPRRGVDIAKAHVFYHSEFQLHAGALVGTEQEVKEYLAQYPFLRAVPFEKVNWKSPTKWAVNDQDIMGECT